MKDFSEDRLTSFWRKLGTTAEISRLQTRFLAGRLGIDAVDWYERALVTQSRNMKN
jgi:hypothetical protein